MKTKTHSPRPLKREHSAEVQRQLVELKGRHARRAACKIRPFELSIPEPDEHIIVVAKVENGKVRVDVTALSFPKEDVDTALRLIAEQLTDLKHR